MMAERQETAALGRESAAAYPMVHPRPGLHAPGKLRELLELVLTIAAIFVLVELAIPRFMVDGHSMEPNFHDADRLIVSRINYLFGAPQRGDIVVFNSPQNPQGEPLIKRVIGLPGETVEISDAIVHIDGVALDEPYIAEPCRPASCADGVWHLGPNQYFVMGDNRNHSNDSRRFGPVKLSAIIGEALIRYWPPSDWGSVTKINFPSP